MPASRHASHALSFDHVLDSLQRLSIPASHSATALLSQSLDPVPQKPVFTLTPLDYNHDGHNDLLLCGNTDQVRLRFGRADANYGLLLTGDGKGGFSAVPQAKSGFQLMGDVRSVLSVGNSLLFGIPWRYTIHQTLLCPSVSVGKRSLWWLQAHNHIRTSGLLTDEPVPPVSHRLARESATRRWQRRQGS